MSDARQEDAQRGFLSALWRYGVVGAGQNLAAYGLSLALLALGLSSIQSMAIVIPLAAVASFLVNRSWTFRTRSARVMRFGRYALTWAAVYPFALIVVTVLERIGAPDWFSNLAAIIAAAGPLFLAMRYWVFALRTPDQD